MLASRKKRCGKPRQHIKKQRHYFADKGLSSQSYGFSSTNVWMWELAIRKAERRRIDAFELWCWRRLLRVPWTTRRSNQPILKKISPEYSLNIETEIWNSNPLDTWCEELTHWKRPRRWERLKAEEGNVRGWDGWMALPTQMDMSLSKLRELVIDREAWRVAVRGVAKSRTWLSGWTEQIVALQCCISWHIFKNWLYSLSSLCFVRREQCLQVIFLTLFGSGSFQPF